MADKNIKDADVTVIITKDGDVVNANGGILKGLAPIMGEALLGFMKLGE